MHLVYIVWHNIFSILRKRTVPGQRLPLLLFPVICRGKISSWEPSSPAMSAKYVLHYIWLSPLWQLCESLLQYQMFALHVMLTYAILLSQQINRFNKAEDRALLITDRHLYKMDPVKQYKPMKSIPLYNVNIYLFDIISCIHTAEEYNCQSYLECKCSLMFKESDNHILQFQKLQQNCNNGCN